MGPISINTNSGIKQPSSVREYREYQQTDKTAIDGRMQRNRISTGNNREGFKYVAELAWDWLTVADFRVIDNYVRTGSGILYGNSLSKYGVLTFSGLPFPDEGEYKPGADSIASFTVRIRQI